MALIPSGNHTGIREVYPLLKDVEIDHAWGGTLAVTRNRLPHFRRRGKFPYIAAGFSGQGIALANFAGECVANAVSGELEQFDIFANLSVPTFPSCVLLRSTTLALATT